MPLYEYECVACHKRTEKIQKFSDPELTVCPHCGGRLERTLTAPAVSFKGGGWYADLYSSKPKSGSEAKSGSETKSSGDAGAGSGGGETKPAVSSESKSSESKPAIAPASSTPASTSTTKGS